MSNTGLIKAGDVITVMSTKEILDYKEAGGETWSIEAVRRNMKEFYEVEAVSPDGILRTTIHQHGNLYIPEEIAYLVWTG